MLCSSVVKDIYRIELKEIRLAISLIVVAVTWIVMSRILNSSSCLMQAEDAAFWKFCIGMPMMAGVSQLASYLLSDQASTMAWA